MPLNSYYLLLFLTGDCSFPTIFPQNYGKRLSHRQNILVTCADGKKFIFECEIDGEWAIISADDLLPNGMCTLWTGTIVTYDS